MSEPTGFRIPFTELKLGEHHFGFDLETPFFSSRAESLLRGGAVRVEITATKQSVDTMLLELGYSGYVQLPCDRCLNVYRHPVEVGQRLVVEVMAEAPADGETIAIHPAEKEVLLDAWLMETLNLQRPIQSRCSDGLDSWDCDPEVVKFLEGEASSPAPDEIDPRWEALKKLRDINQN